MTRRRVRVTDRRTGAVRKRPKSLGRRIARSEPVMNASAAAIAVALRFVHRTTTITFDPAPAETFFREYAPLIVTAWHGQAFMLPFVRPPAYPADVLASRHADGELIARTLVKLGCGVIRGSGASDPSRMHEKGAVAGFRAMKAALDSGHSVALTADFIKSERRKVGPGIIALARMSRRPILPVAFVSSRRLEIGSSWDRTTISLPFGRAWCVVGEAVEVSPRADPAELEAKRAALEAALNAATERATERADGRG